MLSKTLICFLLSAGLGSAYTGGGGSSDGSNDGSSGGSSDDDKHVGTEFVDHHNPMQVECKVSKWECGSCNKKTGWIECNRKVLREPMYAEPCPELTEKRRCDVDCKVTNWGPWKPCTKTCGGGVRSRRREVHIKRRHNGKKCPKTFEFEKCNMQPCKQDCKQSEFDCSPCDKYTGFETCTRKVIIPAKYGGEKCGPATEKRKCPVDCEMTAYSVYGACSKKCGGGWAVKTRKVIYGAKHGGQICGALVYKKACNSYPCSVDCKQSEWRCHSCDKYTGKKICTREVLVTPVYKGKPCGANLKTRDCKVHCEVDYWRPWTICSKKCGTGYQKRYREILHKALNGGHKCPALNERQACNKKPCPVHCKQSEWKCGECNYYTGLSKCHRTTLVHPKHHGRECGLSEKYKPCKVNCEVSKWTQWSYCTKKCGGGFQWRLRSIKYYPKYGGKTCPALKEMRACNSKPCAVHCEQSEWRCSSCDPYRGEQECTRRVIVQPKHHGRKCGANEKIKKCEVDCKVSLWSKYSACSKDCGGGWQERTRKVIYGAKHGGRQCPKLKHMVACNTHKKCSRNCKQSQWQCGQCNKGTGKMQCRREILVYPQGHGKACGPNKKTKYCDVDCQVSGWGVFGLCSKKCGGGIKIRSRTVTVVQRNNGRKCPHLIQRVKCNEHECKRDCKQNETCDECNLYTGLQHCKREVIVRPKGKGKKCKPSTFYKKCVVDCKLTKWGVYSPCSKTCGGGFKTRRRRIGHKERNGGKPCLGKLVETAKCNEEKCVGKKCDPCPKLHCKKGEMEKPAPKGVPCGCPYCESWMMGQMKSTTGLSVAGFAVGGLALAIFGLMKRRKEESEYKALFNSVDAETEDML